jgi:CheY-like chemotaxis protein
VSEPPVPARILHVDDDREYRERARDYLEGEELPGWGTPLVRSLDSFSEALATLESGRFDLVILDVRLGGHDQTAAPPAEEAGVRTLEEIRARRFVPVVFWTGLPGKVAQLSGPLVRVVAKTDGPQRLGEVVRELFDTGLPAVNRALLALVEDEQRRYMWDFVARHWDELRVDGDPLALAYLLARRLGRSLSGPGIHRLAAALGDTAGKPPAENTIHPAEMYIVPPLEGTRPGVADLFCESPGTGDRDWWLMVTPSCDLEHGKAEGIVLAACRPLAGHPDVVAFRERENGSNRGKVRELLGHATSGQRDRYLFLPRAPAIPDLVADFQHLRSVSRPELDAMKRVASLASPFAEAAVSRFTRYFGRVGTGDLDVPFLLQALENPQPASAPAEAAPSGP